MKTSVNIDSIEQISPLISVITVVYNNVATIENAIQSVLAQSYDNVEYIVIDGGSTDGTLDVIKKYQNQISYWVSEKDRGIYDAMNKGIAIAKGQLIGILNSDDVYDSGAIEKIVELFRLNRKIGVYFGGVKKVIFHNGEKSSYYINPPEKIQSIEKQMTIAHGSAFISKELYSQYGLYDLSFPLAADYELFLRLKRQGACFFAVNYPIYSFYEGGASVSIKIVKEVLEIHKKYGNNINGYIVYTKSFLKKRIRDAIKKNGLLNKLFFPLYSKLRKYSWAVKSNS